MRSGFDVGLAGGVSCSLLKGAVNWENARVGGVGVSVSHGKENDNGRIR